MNYRQQKGAMYSTMFTVVMVGIAVLVGFRVFPIYMNELKVSSAVEAVASSPEAANNGTSVAAIRKMLQSRWDVDDIKNVKVSDIQFVKNKKGKVMRYKYEVRTDLFANWALVLSFENQAVLGGAP